MKKVLFLGFYFVAFSLFAQVKRTTNVNKYGVALEGYDPVSYFQKTAIKGNQNIKSFYDGATYFFANSANKAAFDKKPTYYVPQYGGWCAYAVGKTNENVDINPTTYKIKDGKLYLFYNKLFTNTLDLWNKDEQNLLNKAEQNWKKGQ